MLFPFEKKYVFTHPPSLVIHLKNGLIVTGGGDDERELGIYNHMNSKWRCRGKMTLSAWRSRSLSSLTRLCTLFFRIRDLALFSWQTTWAIPCHPRWHIHSCRLGSATGLFKGNLLQGYAHVRIGKAECRDQHFEVNLWWLIEKCKRVTVTFSFVIPRKKKWSPSISYL